MINFQKVALAAAVTLGLLLVGGCETMKRQQSGSSTYAGKGIESATAVKKSRNVSRKETVKKKRLKVRKGRKAAAAKRRKAAAAKGRRTKGRTARGRRSYDAIIRRHAKVNGVPYALARAVVQVESNFRASARGKVGEVGLMQIRKATARGQGFRGSTKALYAPEINIKYGMRYLGKAYRLGGRSTCGAILKYNAGHGAKRMNPVSRRYCTRVRRILHRKG